MDRLNSGAKIQTAFYMRRGHSHVMPFSFYLTNAPTNFRFQVYTNWVLSDLLDVYCIARLVDVVIFFHPREEHYV
jgi:hypothetical protein